MNEHEVLGLIASICIRLMGLAILIAYMVASPHNHRVIEYVDKQRDWLMKEQDMIEVAHMVNDAMGENGGVADG